MTNQPLFMSRKKSKGFTLIEVLIVLAIAAGVLFAVFIAVSKVQTKQVSKEASEMLNLMVADVRAKFKSQGNFTGITPKVLIDNRIPPSSMINGVNIVSPWSSNIAVAPVTINTPNDAVRFTYSNVPQEDCSNFVTAAQGTFTRITVNGTVLKNPTVPQLNVAQLGTACVAQNTATIFFDQVR